MRDITLGETVYFNFTTRSFSTGVPTQLGGTPALSVLESNNATPITSGVSVEVDRASVTGLNQATIVATSGNGYEAGKSYAVYISTGTVGGVSVVGEVVAQFSIQASAAATDLANGTDGLGALLTAINTRLATSGYTAPLDAAGTRSAIGLAAANLDTQLAAIDDYLDTEVAAIKAKTDNLPAAPAAVGDIPTADANAAAILKLDWTTVSGEAARSVLNALRFVRNKWSVSGTTLTVCKEDDTTTAWTGTVTAAPGADPISGNDPA